MNIKERLTQEIEAAKRKHPPIDIFVDLELSKTRPDHFQKKINDLQDEMKKYQISKDWIGSGCKDIIHKIWIEGDEVDWLKADKVNWIEVTWLEAIIRSHLKNRPEDEVWFDVEWFLQKYFLILEYEKYIKIKTSKKQPKKINPDLKLSDVLLEGIPVDEVKKLFKYDKYSHEYLGTFLRYLIKRGYFKRTIHEPEIEILGRNEFNQEFNDRRNYNAKNLNANIYLFRDIPDPKSLIKS